MKKILGFGIIVLSLFISATKSEAASCVINSGLPITKAIVKINFVNSSRAKYPLSDVSVFNVSGSNYSNLRDEPIPLDTKNITTSDGISYPLEDGNFKLDINNIENYRIDKPICQEVDSDGNIIIHDGESIEYNIDAVYTGPLKSKGKKTVSIPAPTTEVLGEDENSIASSTEPIIAPVAVVEPVVETPAPVLVTEVLGEDVFRFNQDLRFGMQNEDVSELQTRLQKEGFFKFDKITGFFGPITKQAVKDYQKAKGIAYITGFCGPLTRAELNK